MNQTFKNIIGVGVMGITASVGLSGCVVSNDPVVNGVATAATVGVITSLIYSISDGYYYDSDYNRMPRNYRPRNDVRIQRVSNIDDYRRQHPRQVQPNNHQRPAQMNGQQPPRPQQNMQQDNRQPRQNEAYRNQPNRNSNNRFDDNRYPDNRY